MIEPIKDLKEVNDKPICVMDDLRKEFPEKFNESGAMDYKWFEKDIRPNFNIFVRHDVDSISFNMLTKPASEGGDLNRCQATELIAVAKHMIEYLNKDYPCEENKHTLFHLNEALLRQEERTADRMKRKVEGKFEL